jgi:hypothetical protein
MDPLKAQRIVFYSFWNNGDVYLTRPMVQYLMKCLPGREYCFAHNCAPDLLADIDGLKYDRSLLAGLPNQIRWVVDPKTSTVFINMWVGLSGMYYVFLPQFGGHSLQLVNYCFSEHIRDLFCIDPPPLTDGVPIVNYSRFHIGDIDRFVQADQRRRVLICNGRVLSKQAENFDFTPIVDRLSHDFPDLLFIPTAAMNLARPNVMQSADIIKKGAPDLNETGYLSMFCDVIVGRSSGPYTFSINPRNLQSAKSFVCFCNKPLEATYGLDDPAFNIKCSFTASSNYDLTSMTQLVQKCINIKLNSLNAAENTAGVLI